MKNLLKNIESYGSSAGMENLGLDMDKYASAANILNSGDPSQIQAYLDKLKEEQVDLREKLAGLTGGHPDMAKLLEL